MHEDSVSVSSSGYGYFCLVCRSLHRKFITSSLALVTSQRRRWIHAYMHAQKRPICCFGQAPRILHPQLLLGFARSARNFLFLAVVSEFVSSKRRGGVTERTLLQSSANWWRVCVHVGAAGATSEVGLPIPKSGLSISRSGRCDKVAPMGLGRCRGGD